ncbi:MAG: 3-deoxy-D-manno-octulosonic acid transferase [Bacteroidetes bacterium]|nr:3-deoxy-D-manno-octulosonic acid transferase [Bacteroidota bacterium]
MKLLYNISLYSYLLLIRIASLFNAKAKLWITGRRHLLDEINTRLSENTAPLVWFHCASLGEFEQGRPLIERYKKRHPDHKILLTFFSPSGYEIRKNYAGADYIYYLPLDTAHNARLFIDAIKPIAVFFVKYEFWFNYLDELSERRIPTYLVSGIFRNDHYFFKSYGKWFRNQLSSFSHFYLQDPQSEQLLNGIGYKNTSVSGDTRFDRVNEIAKNVKQIELVKQFAGNEKVMIAGSSWEEDEKLIASIKLDFKLIIAPHEIDEKHIHSIEEEFAGKGFCLRYSKADEATVNLAQVLIIDNIGMLSSLYQYGTVAFIGGGFGKGIHNILEAATFGLPVIFGPNYEKFTEAKELIKQGGAFVVSGVAELEKTVALLNDEEVLKTASHISKHYVESRVGASDRILGDVKI